MLVLWWGPLVRGSGWFRLINRASPLGHRNWPYFSPGPGDVKRPLKAKAEISPLEPLGDRCRDLVSCPSNRRVVSPENQKSDLGHRVLASLSEACTYTSLRDCTVG